MKLQWVELPSKLRSQRGAALIYISLIMTPILLGIGVIAVDIGNLLVARNELKNAADAGALAGGRFLYIDGSGVNTDADQKAFDAAIANYSQKRAVEVDINADVQRGHWSFATRTFTPNNSTTLPDLWGVDEAILDSNTDFINAIKVTTHRNAAPVASWFGRIFGKEGYVVERTSVAYLGFGIGQADTPWAPCVEYITDDQGNYSCSLGRMSSSGSSSTYETGGWTNLKECGDNPSANELKAMVCDAGSGDLLPVSKEIDMNNGNVTSALKAWLTCWDQQTPLHVTMPVVDCSNGIERCNKVVGTVKAWIVWITESGNKFKDDTPTQMAGIPSLGIPDWNCNCSNTSEDTWNDFTDTFGLHTPEGDPLSSLTGKKENYGLSKDTIYYVPSCEPHAPAGATGGENFGVMAEHPRLVDIEGSDTIL